MAKKDEVNEFVKLTYALDKLRLRLKKEGFVIQIIQEKNYPIECKGVLSNILPSTKYHKSFPESATWFCVFCLSIVINHKAPEVIKLISVNDAYEDIIRTINLMRRAYTRYIDYDYKTNKLSKKLV